MSCSSMRFAIFARSPAPSCVSALVLRARLLPSVKLRGKPVEPCFPEIAVPAGPIVQLAERLRAQRVKPAASISTNAHEARVLEDAELPRHAGLTDIHDIDQLAHGALPHPQCLDEAAAGGISQDLEHVGHDDILRMRNM